MRTRSPASSNCYLAMCGRVPVVHIQTTHSNRLEMFAGIFLYKKICVENVDTGWNGWMVNWLLGLLAA